MQRRRWRLSTELMLWHSIALAAVCLSVGLLSYHVLLRPLERQLPEQAKQFADKMVAEVRRPLWNLNSEEIQKQLNGQRLNSALLDIRVENQFGDILGEWRSSQMNNVPGIAVIEPVYWNRELIGYVHLSWSQETIIQLREWIWPAILGITVTGIILQFLLTWFISHHFLHRPLTKITSMMRKTAKGEYATFNATARHHEIQLLCEEANDLAHCIQERTDSLQAEISERRHIEAELIRHRRNLEKIVQHRTRELDELNQSLRDEMTQRKIAQRAIIQISTHEQQRIGQDLHDTLGQEIVGARYLLSSLERVITSTAPQYTKRLKQLNGMLHDIMEHARMLAHGLMVVDLNEGGLVTALETYSLKTSDLFGVECSLCIAAPNSLPTFDEATAVQLYYIVQEAVGNAIRHGNASQIRITLKRRRNHSFHCLQIIDNGTGFSAPQKGGNGLLIMQSRAESIGCHLTIWSQPGIGSCIRCCLIALS